MSERSKHLTVIVSEPTQDEASALIGHPKMSAASWSNAIHERDAKDAEIAELKRVIANAVNMGSRMETEGLENLRSRWAAERERDEARECVGRLCGAIRAATIMHGMDAGNRDELLCAIAATPEHLRGCATAASR